MNPRKQTNSYNTLAFKREEESADGINICVFDYVFVHECFMFILTFDCLFSTPKCQWKHLMQCISWISWWLNSHRFVSDSNLYLLYVLFLSATRAWLIYIVLMKLWGSLKVLWNTVLTFILLAVSILLIKVICFNLFNDTKINNYIIPYYQHPAGDNDLYT